MIHKKLLKYEHPINGQITYYNIDKIISIRINSNSIDTKPYTDFIKELVDGNEEDKDFQKTINLFNDLSHEERKEYTYINQDDELRRDRYNFRLFAVNHNNKFHLLSKSVLLTVDESIHVERTELQFKNEEHFQSFMNQLQ